MISSDHVLELNSVFHTGQVEPGTCFQKLTGSVPTGTVLKDVSMEVHAGEVMAILGSKGLLNFQLVSIILMIYCSIKNIPLKRLQIKFEQTKSKKLVFNQV